jgi:hypothetical protein
MLVTTRAEHFKFLTSFKVICNFQIRWLWSKEFQFSLTKFLFLHSKLQCEPTNSSDRTLWAAYEEYNKVYTEEIQAILNSDRANSSYQDAKKKVIQSLAQSLKGTREALSSRPSDVGKLLGLVSSAYTLLLNLHLCTSVEICIHIHKESHPRWNIHSMIQILPVFTCHLNSVL